MSEESSVVLEQFQHCLNSSGLVPDKGFRRNSHCYPLLCYVNNITGALLSKNYEIAAVFVARAAEHMHSFPPLEGEGPYYSVATSYLAQVVHHLTISGTATSFDTERIPASILGAGPQQAPNHSFKPKPLRGAA